MRRGGVRWNSGRVKASAMTAVLAAVLLAGCLDGQPSELDLEETSFVGAALVCFDADDVTKPPEVVGADGRVCNQWATVDPWERQANELSIAVNPTDPLNIVATGKDYNPTDAGDCVWDGIYVTHDGGKTWTSRNLEGSNWRIIAEGGGVPHEEFGRFWCATDPVVEFGPDGTLYWTVMPYQCDVASGSKAGRGVVPQGGLNDWLFTCVSMYVLVSEDGGDTFPVVREVAFGERLVHDRQWIGVSPHDDRVLLCWRYSGASVTRAAPQDPAEPVDEGGMACSVSQDKGRTWSRYAVIADRGMSSPWLAYGPDGTAYVAGNSGGSVWVVASPDGGYTWNEPAEVGGYRVPPGGGEHGRSVLKGNTFRLPSYPSIDVDASGGPYDGRVYVAWRDHTNGPDADSDVIVSWSDDDGATWSVRQNLSDPEWTAGVDQFMPALSVGPDGTVDVVFYDKRNDPDAYLFDLYYTYSVDGGANWSKDLRVSEVSVDEEYSRHQNGMVFLGDYIDIDSSAGYAYPVWVDTRHQKADAFVATIARLGANPT